MGGGLDETPSLSLKIFQKSGVSFYSETPPNSNSRDSKIVQIFGIGITAGIFQSGYSPWKWLSSLSTDSFKESNETPSTLLSRGSRILPISGIPKIVKAWGGLDETPSNWLSELRSGSFTEKNETPCVWHPRGSGIEKIGVVFGKEWNSLYFKIPAVWIVLMAELQKSGVFLDKSETPPNSNSRDFKIVQIFGIW